MKKAHFGAIAFFILAAIVMTWPLAANLPLAAAHPGDPAITAWMLDWAFYAITHHPSQLFHAPLFHPLPHTFAFSENILGIMIIVAPLLAMQIPLMLVHNIAILLGFASAGYAAALLGRHLTGSMLAGVAGGFFFAFVPWRFTHLTHLQHLWTLWLPLLILSILRLREQPTRGRAMFVFACFVMNGLTNLHWLAFGSLAAVVCMLILAKRDRFLPLAALSMLAGTLVLVPLLIPYWRAKQMYGMRGDAGETSSYSAQPSDWLIASLHNRVYGPHMNDATVDPERWSFPGLLAPLLALIGIVAFVRRAPRNIAVAIALVLLGFFGSLGLHTPFGRFLFEHIPLFGGIRVPARWSMIAYLGIAMLASCGTFVLARRRWVPLLVIALLFVELHAAPIRWYLGTGETPAVYPWLAKQELRGAVVELPPDQAHAYDAMLWWHVHRQSLINGVSGFKPPMQIALEEDWRRTPIPSSFADQLWRRNASVVIVHRDRLGDRASATNAWLQQQEATGALALFASFGNDDVYATPGQTLTPPPSQSVTIDAVLEHPQHWEEVTGVLEVHGRALSARKVILHFDNHRTRFESVVRNGRFSRTFEVRPRSVRADTDLQVEIIDAQGRRRLLPQVWLRWRRPNERLRENQLPQTADLGKYVDHERRHH
jgi:hypothetical protein